MANILTNPGFETGNFTGWTNSGGTIAGAAYQGAYCASLSNAVLSQQFTCPASATLGFAYKGQVVLDFLDAGGAPFGSGYTPSGPGGEGLSLSSPAGWNEVSADLAPYAGRVMSVRFRNVGGFNTAPGYVDAVSVVGATPPPPAPTGFTATSGQNAQVPTAWNAQAGVDHFSLKRGTAHGGPYPGVVSVAGSASSHTDFGVTNGTAYFYVLTAVLADGTEGAPSAEAAATPSAPAGTLPAGVNLWAAGASPAASAFAAAPLLVDGAADDGSTGYDGT